jgi:hypothetical protein
MSSWVIRVSDRFLAGISVAGTALGSHKTPLALADAGLLGAPGKHPPVAVLTRCDPYPRSALVSCCFGSAHPGTAHPGDTHASCRSDAWGREDGESIPLRHRRAPLENRLLPCADHSRKLWGDTPRPRLPFLSVRIRSWVSARGSSLRCPFRREDECLAGSRQLHILPSSERETSIRQARFHRNARIGAGQSRSLSPCSSLSASRREVRLVVHENKQDA